MLMQTLKQFLGKKQPIKTWLLKSCFIRIVAYLSFARHWISYVRFISEVIDFSALIFFVHEIQIADSEYQNMNRA